MKTQNKYQLPFKENTLTLAISDTRSHAGKLVNAIDFLVKPKTQILAVADGVVTDVKTDSTIGGADPKFGNVKYQNYITIKHPHGEFSQYIHLAPNSSLVNKGDKIKQGQPIAKGIGMIGYTMAPHLHFDIFREEDEQSLEPQWKLSKPKVYSPGKELQKELQDPKYKPLLDSIIKEQSKIKCPHKNQ